MLCKSILRIKCRFPPLHCTTRNNWHQVNSRFPYFKTQNWDGISVTYYPTWPIVLSDDLQILKAFSELDYLLFHVYTTFLLLCILNSKFIFCFTLRSRARIIFRRVVYGWSNQCILVGQDS